MDWLCLDACANGEGNSWTSISQNLYSRISKSSLINASVYVRKVGIYLRYTLLRFLLQWLPYVFIGRATYIYHFYLSVPLLCLATAYFINKYWNTHKGKIAAIAIFVGAVAMFVLFYPVISGAPSQLRLIHIILSGSPAGGTCLMTRPNTIDKTVAGFSGSSCLQRSRVPAARSGENHPNSKPIYTIL